MKRMSSWGRRVEGDGDEESDEAPEEFTSDQGLQQQNEISKAQEQSIARGRRELKERRRKWAARLTPRPKPPLQETPDDEMVEDDDARDKQSQLISGMLPTDIVTLLAAREKQVFLSDSEEESAEKKKPKRKKKKSNISSGVETVILKELPRAHCVDKSLEFLKKRKMAVARSSSVLNNSNQALRLLSSSGLLN